MVDIFDIPVYYIGFNENKTLEARFREIGFKNINHFKAVDGRKSEPKQLLNDKIIDIRAYNDLVYGRQQHTGISSLGTIGCTLSHNKLWELCVNKHSHILIVEDDVVLQPFTQNDIKNIQTILNKPNGAFISTNYTKNTEVLIGLHFYFLSNGAAKALNKKALPINLQTDSYVGHLASIGDIDLEGYKIIDQSKHVSSTGGDMCIKCILPKGLTFYIFTISGIICLILVVVILYKKFVKTKEILESCRSSM